MNCCWIISRSILLILVGFHVKVNVWPPQSCRLLLDDLVDENHGNPFIKLRNYEDAHCPSSIWGPSRARKPLLFKGVQFRWYLADTRLPFNLASFFKPPFSDDLPIDKLVIVQLARIIYHVIAIVKHYWPKPTIVNHPYEVIGYYEPSMNPQLTDHCQPKLLRTINHYSAQFNPIKHDWLSFTLMSWPPL